MRTPFLILLAVCPVALIAGPRTSGNYTVVTDTADVGGLRAASAAYTNAGSAATVAGVSVIAPAGIAKHGYISQIYEVTALELTAPAFTLNETATLQLSAWLELDDATFLAIPAARATWSAIGPLSIAADGLATARNVFQDTATTAQGSYGGFPATLGLTIVNVTSDDFGIYAADRIADDWQVQYFGEDNVLAAPGVDADGDGENNLLEFRAGYIPTDPTSLFATRANGFAGADFVLELSRVQPGTRYVFERTSDFQTWTDVFTLDPVALAEPFSQPLPAAGETSFFRVRLESAP